MSTDYQLIIEQQDIIKSTLDRKQEVQGVYVLCCVGYLLVINFCHKQRKHACKNVQHIHWLFKGLPRETLTTQVFLI